MLMSIIVIPCYNEASRLDTEAFKRFVAEGYSQRFLFVDDGSRDETLSVLDRLCLSDPTHFLLHSLEKNQGKAEAVRQGVLQAIKQDADLVGYWDADLATPLEAIPQFEALFEANPALQIVLGSRVRLLGRHIDRRPLRHYLGRVFATAASLVLHLPVYDTQCGAKLFRVSAETRQLFETPFRTNWIFDVELLARFASARREAGQSVEEVLCETPLYEWREVHGSKVRMLDFAKAAFGLAGIYWKYPQRRS